MIVMIDVMARLDHRRVVLHLLVGDTDPEAFSKASVALLSPAGPGITPG
jgi:hypothetical protein